MGKLTLSFRDHDKESSSVGVRVADYTAGTFDALNTSLDALSAAIDAVSIGALVKDTRLASETETGAPIPSNPYAQRETKWLVRAEGADGKRYTMEIPCADLSLLVANQPFMNIASGPGLDLVTQLEATWLDDEGGAMTVIEVEHVGRAI